MQDHEQGYTKSKTLPHPWPVGTVCVLSDDGQHLHSFLQGPFCILGIVTRFVPESDYHDPTSPHYHEPFGHPAFDNGPLEGAATLYYTSLFSLDPTENGLLCDWEVRLAPAQISLETDEQIERFVVKELASCKAEALAAYRTHRKPHTLPRQALEVALQDLIACGCIPWQMIRPAPLSRSENTES